ncbi:HNH endonuclease [Aureimonas pseudogalii]|uniref:5-methylcytosine-specific restriction endonuclease McrA n=1 Tax=Aureimonas pseudogalii TaxID=1744844 RepID=A0A7W6E9I6_9HYPH|nr:HNH endonuclease signature motif containing protein [Aureimonas pseudogalii]MBB3997251.1 5-methylcytosine-specific restriction endonuclease McrA [Aureimonas pseudogalii]
MPRAHNFTRKQRREMEARAGGCCEKCHAVLKPSEGDADHILSVWMGGESELSNGQWLCRPCHKGKTALDINMIRKVERVRDKDRGVFPKSKRPLRSRGFASTRGTP